MVILVSGIKDHNCIREYLELDHRFRPYAFDESPWLGNHQIAVPGVLVLKRISTIPKPFSPAFEDVVIAFRFLLDECRKRHKTCIVQRWL